MGYRIVYGKRKHRFYKQYKFLLIVVAVFAIALTLFHFTGGIRLPEAALENMVEAVHDGASLAEAVETFCREVIDNAQLYC